MPIAFVYRSHYLGLLSKRVARFDDTSVLAWFQRVWPEACASEDPDDYLQNLLGCRVYGFATVFDKAKHLCTNDPKVEGDGPYPDTWPIELRLLRAAIGKSDTDLRSALMRCAAYPLHHASGSKGAGRAGLGSHAAAWGAFESLAASVKRGGDPARSILDLSDHIAQLASHQSDFFGYQQWFIFDDIWASSYPDLASSLLRYASHWDPWSDDD